MKKNNFFICYIFKDSETMRKIFKNIISVKEDESDKNINIISIDFSKIIKLPDNYDNMDVRKRNMWVCNNWASPNSYQTNFDYKIYSDFARIELESKWKNYKNLFVKLSNIIKAPILIKSSSDNVFVTELCYNNPDKHLRFNMKFSGRLLNLSEQIYELIISILRFSEENLV